jgi:uncharacterized protein (DUF362 family)
LSLDSFGPDTLVSLAPVEGGAAPEQVQAATRRAAVAASDFAWLSPGDVVFIKPVVNSGKPYPATTSPAAVAAMIRLLKEKGAGRVVVGDMGGVEHVKQHSEVVKGSTRQLAQQTGLAQAAEDAGAELSFFEEAGWEGFFEERPQAGSHWKGGLMLPAILREVDHIVLMPRCGRHALLGATLGLKAVVGYMRFDTRLEYHHQAAFIQEKTAEANTVPTLLKKQRLVLTAADKVLTTYGPDKGYVQTPPIGLVIASPSVVAHDLVSLAWLLLNRQSAPKSQLSMINDPYSSQLVVNIANHVVTGMLGGWGPALSAQKLVRHDIAAVWQDRVLARACQIMGGAPRVELRPAGPGLPPGLMAELEGMVAHPQAG